MVLRPMPAEESVIGQLVRGDAPEALRARDEAPNVFDYSPTDAREDEVEFRFSLRSDPAVGKTLLIKYPEGETTTLEGESSSGPGDSQGNA